MRADVEEADRRYEVREAARGWQRAAAVDEETRKKIDAAYPDDRNRLGPVFRVLVFGFSLVVLQSALGIVGLGVRVRRRVGGRGRVLAVRPSGSRASPRPSSGR